MGKGKPESQPANQKDNTMINTLDDPGMTVAATEAAVVETSKEARKNIHLFHGFRVMFLGWMTAHRLIPLQSLLSISCSFVGPQELFSWRRRR